MDNWNEHIFYKDQCPLFHPFHGVLFNYYYYHYCIIYIIISVIIITELLLLLLLLLFLIFILPGTFIST